MRASLSMPSPIGPLLLEAAEGRLTHIHIGQHPPRPDMSSGTTADHAVLHEAKRQLDEYFAGKRREFDLPYKLDGTPFQCAVWSALCDVPYGETASYKDIAVRLNNPNATRAIGSANKSNKLPLIVPCHRIIAADGSLGGYSPGPEIKQLLLDLEQR